jgi:hypothetical protein
MVAIKVPIAADSMIPDVLRACPQLRGVLDRYGLRGCGGEFGPVESVGSFARAHDVPVASLLSDLRMAVSSSSPTASTGTVADYIYRPFFKAGIVIALTLGAVWGAYLLLRIAFAGSFRAVGLHEVNAHGHAQIFGWVGLFVMGFAYQAFPRFKHTSLTHPRLAYASLWLMLCGITVRSIYEPLAASFDWQSWPAVVAAVVEIIAIGVFTAVIAATWRASGKPLAYYDAYIACALFWFVAQAVYEAVYLAATFATGDSDLVPLVATWQAPLRDIQIHGFALMMILGVSQRLLHPFYGFKEPNRRLSLGALVALNFALVGEVSGLVAARLAGHAWIGMWYASVLLLTGAVVLLVWDWRIFAKAHESDRSLKFLRAAYVWLLISLGMMVLLPVYQFGVLGIVAPESEAARIGFSHAYYGAIRHAITVGFISVMIVGVASKVVPSLNGVDTRSLRALWAPFVLINTGCALRVIFQTLTDTTSLSFPVAGISGLLEVAGLAIWGAHLWWIMHRGAALEKANLASDAHLAPTSPITAQDRVGDVLEYHPYLLNTFLSFGFHPLSNPWLRRTLARSVTLGQACRILSVDISELLEALNTGREKHVRGTLSLPVLDFDSRGSCGASAPVPTTHSPNLEEA